MSSSPQHDASSSDEQDVDAWIQQLRAASNTDSTSTTKEERAMYQSIIRHHERRHAELVEDALSDEHAWQQMRFRLQREGLLKRRYTWKTWVPMAMAAGLLAAVALPTMLNSGVTVLEAEPVVLRGDGLSFRVQDPLRQAKELAKELKALDPELKLYWHDGVATIDLNLDAPQLEQAEASIHRKVANSSVRLQPGFSRLVFTDRP